MTRPDAEEHEPADLAQPRGHHERRRPSRQPKARAERQGEGQGDHTHHPGGKYHPDQRKLLAHSPGRVQARPEGDRSPDRVERGLSPTAFRLSRIWFGNQARQDHADGDDAQQRPGPRGHSLTCDHRKHCGDTALGRGDRRHDADLPDPKGTIFQEEPEDVARPGQGEPTHGTHTDARRQGRQRHNWRRDHQAHEHYPSEDRRRPDHSARPRRADSRDGPGAGGAEAAEDRDHAIVSTVTFGPSP
ncbi:MAG TPA: hypothetical protein VGL18_08105 [Actinomycetota bacterium]